MQKRASLAAAILVGGRAERFGGQDKSSLRIGGLTILQRILDAVAPSADPVFAVGDRHGRAAAAGLHVVADALPGTGALGAIYTAIVESPCDRTFVIGCDMPFVTSRFVAYMAGIGAADVVIPRDAAGYQPLCAIYSRACIDPVRERLARGERQAAVPPQGVRVVEIGSAELSAFDPEGLLFVNVNTPHDYERARQMVECGRAPV